MHRLACAGISRDTLADCTSYALLAPKRAGLRRIRSVWSLLCMPVPSALPRLLHASIMALMITFLVVPPALAQAPATPATPVTSASYDPDELHIIKPDLRAEIAATLPAGLTRYEIDLAFPEDPESRVLTGNLTVIYTNTTGETLDELPFRLYANSAAEENDAVTMDTVTVDGSAVTPVLSEMNSVAMLPLPAPLPEGGEIRIEVSFTTTVPVDDPAHYGIYNYASETRTWSLAHWYPVVAGRDPYGGWMLAPTSENGDPVYTETGMYTVRITARDSMEFISSGVPVASEPAGTGWTTTTFSAAPSRDFVMLADTDMQLAKDVVDGTTVTSWYHEGHAAAGEAALLWSSQSLALFNELLGEYPFVQLQLSEAFMFNAAGVEYPQLFTVGAGYYREAPDLDDHGFFEFTVAHEVVHQWFYSIVGNNQYVDAFIDEGLTNYLSSRVYFTRLYGEEVGREVFERNIARPFRFMIESNADVIVSTATDAFPTEEAYVNAAYVKAPMGFGALHEEMGDEAFFGALQAYVEEYRFRVATPADLFAAFDRATTASIEPIWNRWFERREGGLDIRNDPEGHLL